MRITADIIEEEGDSSGCSCAKTPVQRPPSGSNMQGDQNRCTGLRYYRLYPHRTHPTSWAESENGGAYQQQPHEPNPTSVPAAPNHPVRISHYRETPERHAFRTHAKELEQQRTKLIEIISQQARVNHAVNAGLNHAVRDGLNSAVSGGFKIGIRSSKKAVSNKTKLFVGNLPDDCTDEDLYNLFSKYGYVTECHVINKYGFVFMSTAEEAEDALKALNHYYFKGSSLNVEVASGVAAQPSKEGNEKAESKHFLNNEGHVSEDMLFTNKQSEKYKDMCTKFRNLNISGEEEALFNASGLEVDDAEKGRLSANACNTSLL